MSRNPGKQRSLAPDGEENDEDEEVGLPPSSGMHCFRSPLFTWSLTATRFVDLKGYLETEKEEKAEGKGGAVGPPTDWIVETVPKRVKSSNTGTSKLRPIVRI